MPQENGICWLGLMKLTWQSCTRELRVLQEDADVVVVGDIHFLHVARVARKDGMGAVNNNERAKN